MNDSEKACTQDRNGTLKRFKSKGSSTIELVTKSDAQAYEEIKTLQEENSLVQSDKRELVGFGSKQRVGIAHRGIT